MFDILLPYPVLWTLCLAMLIPLLLLFADNKLKIQELILPIGSGAVFALYAALTPRALTSDLPKGVLVQILPGMDVSFLLDAVCIAPCLAISLASFVGSFFLITYLQAMGSASKSRTMILYACVTATALGICQAASITTLLLMAELLILFMLPLVGDESKGAGSQEREGAGDMERRTLLMHLYAASRLCLLPAVILTYLACGTLEFATAGNSGMFPQGGDPTFHTLIFGLFVAGLAISGLVPFHGWLVQAISGSSPITGFLAGPVAATAGTFALCRVMISGFGLERIAELGLNQPLSWLGGAAVILGALAALGRLDLKSIFAYCTLSQLGFSLIGVSLLNENGVTGALGNLAIFTLTGATLLMVVGAVQVGFPGQGLVMMRGLGRRMPWTFGAMTAAGLTMIGLPPSAGFVDKNLLYTGVSARGDAFMGVVMIGGSLLLGGCLLRLFCTTFFQLPAKDVRLAEYREARAGLVIPTCIMAISAIALGCFPDLLLKLLGV